MHVRDTHTQLNTCTPNTSKHLHTQTHPHTCSHMHPQQSNSSVRVGSSCSSWRFIKSQYKDTVKHMHTHSHTHRHSCTPTTCTPRCHFVCRSAVRCCCAAVQDWKPPLINVQSIKGDYSLTCSLQFCNYSLRAECVITSKTGSSQ